MHSQSNLKFLNCVSNYNGIWKSQNLDLYATCEDAPSVVLFGGGFYFGSAPKSIGTIMSDPN